jgi:hypothetical protein
MLFDIKSSLVQTLLLHFITSSALIIPQNVNSKSINTQRFSLCCSRIIPPYRRSSRQFLQQNEPKRNLLMSLEPLTSSNINMLFPRTVSNEQWVSYWGINERERLQRVLESFLISYGGAWLAWYSSSHHFIYLLFLFLFLLSFSTFSRFLSFLAGGFVAGIVGSLLVFNWMYTPWLSAYRRNGILKSGKFYYGFFDAKIDR